MASSERQLQLERAAEEWTEASGQAYQEVQARHREMRNLLFTFLTAYSDAELNLRQRAHDLQGDLDADSTIKLNALVAQGLSFFCIFPTSGRYTKIQLAAAHARFMLQDQVRDKIADAFEIDHDSNAVDTFSLAPLPVIPDEDREKFFEFL